MAEDSEQEQSPRLDQSRIMVIGLVLILLASSFGMAIATGPTTATTSLCTASNQLCGPIKFITSVFGNATSTNTVTTSAWSALGNQSMVVVASVGGSLTASNVSSVSDLQNDRFTRFLQQQNVAATGFPDLEVWFGQTSLTSINQVTINWNATENVLGQVIVYQGVSGLGVKNSTFQNGAQAGTPSLTIKTSQSGSWIGGVLSLSAPNLCTGSMGSSPQFIDRNDGCASTGCGFDCYPVTTSVADNSTALRNTVKLAYAPTQDASGTDLRVAEFTILPVDVEPNMPDFGTFCTISNTPCTYMNFAGRTSGANTLQNIVVGTSYCTGITTSALTITVAHLVQGLTEYSGQSRNDTGAILLVQVYYSTNVPSTSFGSGLCASGGLIAGLGKVTFTTSGATVTAYGLNEYATSINTILNENAGTFYAWIEITPQSVGSGNLGSTIQYAQWGASGHSSIAIFSFQ